MPTEILLLLFVHIPWTLICAPFVSTAGPARRVDDGGAGHNLEPGTTSGIFQTSMLFNL